MKNPFKKPGDEPQDMNRLTIIAGSTLVIGCTLSSVYCLLVEGEPRHPFAFMVAAGVGLVLLIAGLICAKDKGPILGEDFKPEPDPVSNFGVTVLVICLIVGVLLALFVPVVAKPVIYLYPTQTEDVRVQLDYIGKVTAEYPARDLALGGWEVTASPDGRLVDPRDGREYSYLYWEGEDHAGWDLSTGFVVRGADTRRFLQDTLPRLGLTPREYNEFIVYWYPKMQNNAWNLVHFAGREYTDRAPLTITPTPESVIRVFMVWKPLPVPVSVPVQAFPPVSRHGFTVVEWGGAEVR